MFTESNALGAICIRETGCTFNQQIYDQRHFKNRDESFKLVIHAIDHITNFDPIEMLHSHCENYNSPIFLYSKWKTIQLMNFIRSQINVQFSYDYSMSKINILLLN